MHRALAALAVSFMVFGLAGCRGKAAPRERAAVDAGPPTRSAADAGAPAREDAGVGAVADAGVAVDGGAAAAPVPSGVRFVKNPKWKEGPTPADLVNVDKAAGDEDWGQAHLAYEQRLKGACMGEAKDVVVLDPTRTRIGYVAYKDGSLAVPGHFQRFAGFAVLGAAEPRAHLVVDVLSIDSGNLIRDLKLEKIFFQVGEADNGVMTYQAAVTGLARGDLPAKDGEVRQATLDGRLTLHGVTKHIRLPLNVTHEDGGWRARLAKETLLPLGAFQLVSPLRALMISCNHRSLGNAVVLDFDLFLVPGCGAQK